VETIKFQPSCNYLQILPENLVTIAQGIHPMWLISPNFIKLM